MTPAASPPLARSDPPPGGAPPPAAAPPTVTITASGDLVLNPHAMRAIADDGPRGYEHLLAGFAAAVHDDALVVVNLEQPLVNDLVDLDPGWPRQDTSRPRRSPVLGATPALADALADAGVHVACVTNNHAYDQGRRGLARTLEELTRAHIVPIGAGADAEEAYRPSVVERDGVRVAWVAFSGFFNQHPGGETVAVAARLDERAPDDGRLAASLAAARATADVVVASVHWGRDFDASPRASQRRLARRLVELGADVVLGTGPHVLHPVERLPSPRGEAVIAYSLGNLVSGMGRTYRLGHPPHGFIHPANVTPEARDGVVLRITVEVGERLRITALTAEPLWTQNNWLLSRTTGTPHRVSVLRLSDADEATRAERTPRIMAALGEAVRRADPR